MNIIILILLIVLVILYIYHINNKNIVIKKNESLEKFAEEEEEEEENDEIKKVNLIKRDPVERPEIPPNEMSIYNALLYSGFKYAQNIFLKTPYTFNNIENIYYNFNTFIEIYFPQLLYDTKFKQFILFYNFINSHYLSEITTIINESYKKEEFDYKYVNKVIMFNEKNIHENRSIYERMFGRLNINTQQYQDNYNTVLKYYMKRLRNINEIYVDDENKTVTIDFKNNNAGGDKSYTFKYEELPEYQYTLNFINIKASKFANMYKFVLMRLSDMAERVKRKQMERINSRVERKPKYYNSETKQGSNSYKNIKRREINEYYDNQITVINQNYDKIIDEYNRTNNPTNDVISDIESNRQKELDLNETNRKIEIEGVLGNRKTTREETKQTTKLLRDVQKAIDDERNDNNKSLEYYYKNKIEYDNLKLKDYNIYNFDLLDIIKFNVIDNMKDELIDNFIRDNAPILSKHVQYNRNGDIIGMDISDHIIIQQIVNPYDKIIKGFDYAVIGRNFQTEEEIQFELRELYTKKLYENLTNIVELYNTIFNPSDKVLKLNRIGMIILQNIVRDNSNKYMDVDEMYWDFKYGSFQLYISEHINNSDYPNISSIFDNYPIYKLEEENLTLDLMIENTLYTYDLTNIINKEKTNNLKLMNQYHNNELEEDYKNVFDIVNDTKLVLNKELHDSILTIYNNDTSAIHIIGVLSYINKLLQFDSVSKIINTGIDNLIKISKSNEIKVKEGQVMTESMKIAEQCNLDYGNCLDAVGVYGVQNNKVLKCLKSEFKKENEELYDERKKLRVQITKEAFLYIGIAVASAVLTIVTAGAAAPLAATGFASAISSTAIVGTMVSSTFAAVLSASALVGTITALSLTAQEINTQQLYDMRHNYISAVISCEALLNNGDIDYIFNIRQKLYDVNDETEFKILLKHELIKILYNYTSIKSAVLFTILKLEIQQGVKSSEYNMKKYLGKNDNIDSKHITSKITYMNDVINEINTNLDIKTPDEQPVNEDECENLPENAKPLKKLKQINCKINQLKEKHDEELVIPFKTCRDNVITKCDDTCENPDIYKKYPGKNNIAKRQNCRRTCQSNLGEFDNTQFEFCNENHNMKIFGEGYKYKGHNSDKRFRNCMDTYRLENNIEVSADTLCGFYCENDVYFDKYKGALKKDKKGKCKQDCLTYNSRRSDGISHTEFIKTYMENIANCNRTCEKATYYNRFTGVIRDKKVKCYNKCKIMGRDNFINEINACKTECETTITYNGDTQEMYRFFKGINSSRKLNNCRQQCAISGSQNMSKHFVTCANECEQDNIYRYFRGILNKVKRRNCRNECVAAIPIYKSLIRTNEKCTKYCDTDYVQYYGNAQGRHKRCMNKCHRVDGNRWTLNNGELYCYNEYIKDRKFKKKLQYALCMDRFYERKNDDFEKLQQMFSLIEFDLDGNGIPLDIIYPPEIENATRDELNSIWNEYRHILDD
jgi:hypothetical protein